MQTRTRFPRLRFAGFLRVLALLAVIQLIALALWLGSAHARASESLLSVGAELMRIEGAHPNQPVRSVFINGVTVHLRAATTDQGLHTVLDRFHSLCRERTGIEAPQAVLDKLRANGAKSVHSPRSLDGVLRTESDSAGALACIDTGAKLSLAELASRLQDFAKIGDLSAVGELRYVLAHRVDGKTSVLTMWTEGPTPLLKMFPSAGDAPGQDLPGVPRAPGARRLLSTWENGQPYSFTVYTVAGANLETLRAFYAKGLLHEGWSVQPSQTGSHEPTSKSLVGHRGSQTILVRIAEDSHGQPAVSVAALD